MDVNTKSYWNGNGRFEEEYEELLASPNVKWTKEEQEIKYRYYRYYNDGDLPYGANFASISEIEEYEELQLSIVIAKVYCRVHQGEQMPSLIWWFAKKPYQSFKAWKYNKE